MKLRIHTLAGLLLVLAGVAVARAADGTDVMSPVKRQEVLDRAKKLLATREPRPAAADPFHSEAFDEALAATGRVPGTTPSTTPGTVPDATTVKPAGPR